MFINTLMSLFGVLRLGVYRRLFESVKDREGSLSATEAFSVDIIHLLGEPTLSQFAATLNMSQPSATYKINSLTSKGYVTKSISEQDRRELRIHTTEKFDKYFTEAYGLQSAMDKLEREYSPAELETAEKVLRSFMEAGKEDK